jgi:hypothetical protein
MDSDWLTTKRGPIQKGPTHSVIIQGQVPRPLLVETRSAFSVNMHTRKNLPRRVMVHFRPPDKAYQTFEELKKGSEIHWWFAR